jgi:uncharacterized protein (TIGR01777 family)
MRVVLTGATGLVGEAALARLRQRGDDVLGVARRVPAAREGVEWLAADLTEPGPWQAALASRAPEAVVHLAGEPLDVGRWTKARKERLVRSRVETTRRIVEAIAGAAAPPRVLVCASAVGIYGARGEELLEESSAPGAGFLAELCQRWEEEAGRASHAGVRTVSLRFAPVLSRRGGALPRMARAFKLFVGGPLAAREPWFPWIHEDDAAGLVLHAVSHTGALSGPVNAVAPEHVRMGQFADALGRALRRPAALTVPAWALRAVLGELAGSIVPGQKIVPAAALASGYQYQHPTLAGALASILG